MTRPIANLIALVVLYSLPCLIVLGLCAFIFKTWDFSTWGQTGRTSAFFLMICFYIIGSVIIETSEARKHLANLLMGDEHD